MDHHWHASETLFKWRLARVPMLPEITGIWIHSSAKKQRCHSWTSSEKHSGSAHAEPFIRRRTDQWT